VSKYTDIATGKYKSTLPVVKKPVTQAVKKTTSPGETEAMRKSKETIAALEEQRKEEIRNPVSAGVMKKGKEIANKYLGKGWASDLIGSLPGGILRSAERPARFLFGAGYGLGQAGKAAAGDAEALRSFQANENPFMTPEDMAALRSRETVPTGVIRQGQRMAGDVLSLLAGAGKGAPLTRKLLMGGFGGMAAASAEEKVTPEALAQGTIFGMGTAGAGHLGGKMFGKLKGKAPEITTETTPTIAPETPKELPAGNVREITAPKKRLESSVNTDIFSNQSKRFHNGSVYGPELYHETSAANASDIIQFGGEVPGKPLYVSNTPELAVGQGGKGVIITYDSSKVMVKPPPVKKPSAGFLESQGKTDELIASGMYGKNSIKSITIKDPKQFNSTVIFTKRGNITRSDIRAAGLDYNNPIINPDGSLTFVKQKTVNSIVPGQDNIPEVPGRGELITTESAIEGEVVNKEGLIVPPGGGKGTGIGAKPPAIEAAEPIKTKLLPGQNKYVGLKTTLARFGNPGKKVASMLDEFENQAHTLANTSYNAFNRAVKNFESETAGTKLPMAGSYKNVVQYVLDEYNHVPHAPISPGEKKIAETFFKLVTLPTSLEAKRFGLAPDGKVIGPARMFLPAIIRDKTKWSKSMMERLVAEGNTADEAAKIIESVIGGRKAPPLGTRPASFEHARSFFPKTFDDLVKFGYETDLKKIAAAWSKNSWRRIAAMRVFGNLRNGEHSNLAAEFQNMLKGGVMKEEVDNLKRNFMNSVEGAPKENELIQGFGKVARAYGGWKIGPSVAIQQPSTLGQVAGIAGEGRTTGVIIKTFLDKLGLNKIPAGDKALVENAGIALNGGLDDILRSEYGSGGSTIVNAIEKIAGVKLKISGTPAFDTAIRKVAAYSSLDWIRTSVKKLASGKLSPKAYNTLYDEINRFAVPMTSELDDMIARGGDMTPFETSKAIYNFGKKTQFGLARSEVPADWSNSTLGRVTTQLKSFGYEQMQLYGRLYDHGRKTGNFSPLIKSIIYTVGINTASARVISLLLKSPEQRKKETLKSTIMNGLGQTLLGPFFNALTYSSSGGEAIGGLVAGPSLGDVGTLGFQGIQAGKQEIGNIGAATKKHAALRTFLKSAYKKVPPFSIVAQTPVIGPKVTEKLFPSTSGSRYVK
jgi:hypothetical protein